MQIHANNRPETTTQALANAEAQLATAAKRYRKIGETHLESLLRVCSTSAKLKEAYKRTPKHERPERTWIKYVIRLSKRKILAFASARMADLCAALDRDIRQVDHNKVRELASDGSYGAVRSAVDQLLGKSKVQKKQGKSAIEFLGKALKAIEKAEELMPDAESEIGAIKTAIQRLMDNSPCAERAEDRGQCQSDMVMPKPSPAQTPLATEVSKNTAAANTSATFTPKSVAEIASALGGKSALGRAVGKTSKHADYWAKVDKFPSGLRPQLAKIFGDKNQVVDLSLIAPTK